MTDFQTWLDTAGFKRNPFGRAVADTDKYLNEYFIKFPYYSHVRGKANYPQTAFLFAERGGGKTANRLQIERHCRQSLLSRDPTSRILGIPFTDFTTLLEKDSGFTLYDYVNEILKQAVPTFYDIIFDPAINEEVKYASFVKELSPEDRADLVYYIKTFSNRLSDQSIRRSVQKIQRYFTDIPQDTIIKATKVAVKGALQIFGQADIPFASLLANSMNSLVDLMGEKEVKVIESLKRSPLELMEQFCNLVKLFEIQSIYIIVDRIDEYAGIDHDFRRGLQLVKPLVEAVPLLEMPQIAFKFFLPAELESEILQLVRTDRFIIFHVSWKREDLEKILSQRLKASLLTGHGPHVRLGDICEESLRDRIDNAILNYSRSPRDVIRLGGMIFSEHGRNPQEVQPLITEDEFKRAVTKYVRDRFREMDKTGGESELVANMAQIGLLEFQLNDVVARLSLNENEAREFLRRCEQAGYLEASFEVSDARLRTYIGALAAISGANV